MFPGLTTRVSEEFVALTTSIKPSSDLVHVTNTTSTTVLVTIVPPYAGFSGILFLVNRSGANMTTTTAGNIAVAHTIPVNMPISFTFSKLTGIWYPGAIS